MGTLCRCAQLPGLFVCHPVFHIHLDSVILCDLRLDHHRVIKMNHTVVLAGHRQYRTDDLHLFHLLITKPDLFHQIHPCLFHPFDIVGMMDNSHLVCLIILCVMLIRADLDRALIFPINPYLFYSHDLSLPFYLSSIAVCDYLITAVVLFQCHSLKYS